MDTKEFLMGKAKDAYTYFGAVKKDRGYIFRLLAPNADQVSIIGDFNNWEPSKMRGYKTGIYSVTIKDAKLGDRYQFVIKDKAGNEVKKIDPFARKINLLENSAVITDDSYKFKNKKVKTKDLNIYEVHLGSLFKDGSKSKAEILDRLLIHLVSNNFTHIKLMPVAEHSSYKSMGYVSSGFFAISERYGEAVNIRKFIDSCHGKGLGVICELDISQFDNFTYGLRDFDGTRIFDYDAEDIHENYYGSINFDFSKNTNKSYIKSVISYYLDEFNLDGISLSNLENLIYWQGDKNRGINKVNVEFLREITNVISISKALSLGSFNGIYDFDLRFDYVFDNSTRPLVRVLQKEPILRDNFRSDIYKFISGENKNKILGFNHIDSYLNEARVTMKMLGDTKKFDQLKTLFTLIYCQNSKKQVFMGDEIGDLKTWSIHENVDFINIDEGKNIFNKFYQDLADLYLTNEILSNTDSETEILDIEGYSIFAYKRVFDDKELLVINNLTDLDYLIKSAYNLNEILNTEDLAYGGSGNVNGTIKVNEKIKIMAYGSAIFEIKKG